MTDKEGTDGASRVPVRVQRKRAKGWRMPENTVYVGRGSVFGNPFTVEHAIEAGYLQSAKDTLANLFLVDCFRDWVTGNTARHDGRNWWQGPESDERKAAIEASLHRLRGKNLACWCPLDQPCHADVLLELANKVDGEAAQRAASAATVTPALAPEKEDR